MSGALLVDSIGPLASVQDSGRPGMIALGLSRGGAMDATALDEAAAVLGLPNPVAAIEMAGRGGTFRSDAPLRFALTGAAMQASVDGRAIGWGASHLLLPGQRLQIGGVLTGTWGYLTPAAPISTAPWRGSVSAHLAAGIGRLIVAGDRLALGRDPAPDRAAMRLPQDDRFSGGTLRLMPGSQTHLFDSALRARIAATAFARSPQANRQATRLDQTGPPFDARGGGGLISDFTQCGDVQVTGGGIAYILMAECQTIGGYPRLGTVIAADLPRAAQAPAGSALRFAFVDTDTADRLYVAPAARLAALRRLCRPATRHPADVPDLMSLQLISGVTTAHPKENQ